MKGSLTIDVELAEGVSASYENKTLTVKGPKGEVARKLTHPTINVSVVEGKIVLKAPLATQRQKRLINTFASHARNFVQGVQEPHVYKLKVCSGHFPMNLNLSKESLTVKNFLGEAVPRVVKLSSAAQVKLDGDIITVTSVDKEAAGNQAAQIEQLTRITNRDRRIFQDGIYMIVKDGVDI